MKLSRPAREKARSFLQQSARPLEQARYACHFASGRPADVLAALAPFQNPDGGFGNGLEPDFRLPASSALATTVGLQILREVGAPAGHPLVQGAIRYLLATYDADHQVWPIIPPNDNRAPHAPWWNYAADLAASWRGFQANPRAEVLGYLYDWADQVPPAVREELTAAVVDYLAQAAPELEMHDFLCYLRLAETASLPGNLKDLLLEKLQPVARRLVSREPAQWSGYGLRPLDIANAPDSPFAALLAEEIDLNLDHLIATQQPDGAWNPAWTWGGQFPEVWPITQREWKGVSTLHALKILRNFGRIA